MTDKTIPHRSERVAAIEAARAAWRENAAAEVRAIQADCPHDKVIESRGPGMGARRICARCGLEEVTWYGFPAQTIDGGMYEFQRAPGQRTVLNTEFVKDGDVCAYRVRI